MKLLGRLAGRVYKQMQKIVRTIKTSVTCAQLCIPSSSIGPLLLTARFLLGGRTNSVRAPTGFGSTCPVYVSTDPTHLRYPTPQCFPIPAPCHPRSPDISRNK